MRLEPCARRDIALAVAVVVVALLATLLLPVIASAQSATMAAEIRRLIDAKQYSEAEKALAAAGDDDSLASLRAELYRRTDRRDEAYLEYQRVLAANPGSTDAQFWLATIDGWRGRTNDAISGYENVLAMSNCHRDALTGRARAYESLGNLALAEADLRMALQCKPDDTGATELLSRLLARQGNRAEAASILHESFSGVELEWRLGDLELGLGDGGAAREHYRAALALQPDDAILLDKLAAAERVLGNNAAALALYEQSAALAGDGGNLYWIGLLSLRLGRLDRAEEAFDAMLERKPTDSGALIGKARIRRSQGRKLEALQFVNEVLQRDPSNGEALVLRGTLYSSLGRRPEARDDYLAALARNPDDGDARLLLDRLGPAGYATLSGRSSRSRVIEGLEDEGVLVDGVPIRPTRIEYINDFGDLEFGFEVGAHSALGGTVSRGREVVKNDDRQSTIYDFNVLTALAGFDQYPSENLRFSWRLGGTRYDPRSSGAIETSSEFRGNAELTYDHSGNMLTLGISRRPFIWRGFAGDTEFSIFAEDRIKISWERSLGRNVSVRFSGAASNYGDGDRPVNGGVSVRWDRGGNALFVRAGHDPIPARRLDSAGNLEFIDIDGVTVGGRAELDAGFRFSGDVTYGRYGKTMPQFVIDGEQVEGPPENNTERRAVAELAWSPPAYRPFSIGAAYQYAEFDFRTSPYSTTKVDDRSLFAELADKEHPRVRYSLRVGHHRFDDDKRTDKYYGNAYLGRLELRLGRTPDTSGSYWLGLEGVYRENDLDDERYKMWTYLTIPF